MTRKNQYIGGIIGASPLVSSAPRPGVSNLGSLGGDGAGYAIDHSLRLDGSADYMKFPQGTPTSSNTWTFSCWVKRSANSGGSGTPEQMLLAAGSNSSNYNQIAIANNDTLRIRNRQNGVWYRRVYTTDTVTVADGWTHIVVSTDPISVYINGQVPAIEPPTNSSGASWPYINASGYDLHIGRDGHAAQNYFNGQLAEVHFIDGTTYDPTEFGELVGGVWYPKEVTGLTYGNNGFYLDFADNSTASALGNDVSGNSNNFSVTSIATSDQSTDAPAANPSTTTTRPTRRWGGITGRSLVEAGAGTPAFKAVTWAGDNGTNRGITGVGFEPGLVWLKNRDDNVDTGSNHMVFDAVRGATKYLQTDNTDPEETNANSLKSFDADGFTIGALQRTNTSGKDYVAWCLKAGGAGVSNPTGSITSTVSANTAAGFSVVEYTGNETAGATVGHGLGSAPDMIIVKDTDTTDNWAVYHSGLGGGNAVLFLESTAGVNTSLNMWDSTTPSSSVITLGDRDEVNRATAHIAYCFHSVPGFSKIGSYSGSASSTTSASENNYIALGFRPAFIMFKRATSADDWIIVDNARDPDNSTTTRLRANSFALEDSNAYAIVDFNDSGFTLRGGNAGLNYTGNTYIYMAFAEEIPGADAIPTTGVLSLAEHYQSKL